MKKLIIFLIMLSSWQHGFAQTPEKKADSTSTQPKGMQAYSKIITDKAKNKSGLFTVSQVDTKYYFQIPDSLFNRYMLVVTRYLSTPEGMGIFGGEKANEQTIYFEKGTNNTVFLRSLQYRQDVRSADSMLAKALAGSNENPIVAAFPIKTTNPDNGNVVIDVTDSFKKDNAMFSIGSSEKTEKKLTSLADDKSFVETIDTYPINIEVKTTKTYTSSTASSGSITLRLNTSIVLLPKIPMRKRFFDERVGYFANKYVLFDDDEQRAQKKFIIQRYRLEPKDKDIKKYLRGELVEPKKQIVYYIDPATPKKWRPYLIAGINDWQKAFEAAGFKNAIVGKEWPEDDKTMSLEDARYSVVRYLASETPNAYGPRISDPRSGEIMESHVGWYHNVMKLVQRWYMIQAGPLDARARKMHLDDELMGQLIRFVSSHEIGHTIGLRHNMGASSATPVEKLRDKKWVEANGHTVSIMDYARFNYVAQPEDNISPVGLYPRIGSYDKWAVQWGYKYYPNAKDEFEEENLLAKLTTDSLTANPKLWFGGEGKDEDPRSQAEDLGDDAVLASDYGIKNLKRVVPHLIEWTYQPNDPYDNLADMHKAVVRQYGLYLYHVLKYIGNNYVTKRTVDEKGAVYKPVPKAKIKAAIDYLGRQLFVAPLWMYPQEIDDLIALKREDQISDQQNQILNMLLSSGMLYNISLKSMQSEEAYTVPEFLNDVQQIVWVKFSGDEKQDYYRRSFQRGYVEKLGMLLLPKEVEPGKASNTAQRSDVRLYGKQHLLKLKTDVAKLMNASTGINKDHYESILIEIDKIITKLDKPTS
ncbi:zinc-dependent metalloprotease [Flavobacterium ginsenosidimutans]|uniref:Zinc-dependent metalloprotease n=1 Tax=Flavobacterium ginsenosidimutans TaxID=687844 RepID=A0ABZ2Q5L4_9FLAO|nr:zinc-dependent metalloprotease [Flavobacterium ginsenosidimutans]KAF2328681.1 zinc-dependent metalloprotease [Flavobacterium ginsenosidimutans]